MKTAEELGILFFDGHSIGRNKMPVPAPRPLAIRNQEKPRGRDLVSRLSHYQEHRWGQGPFFPVGVTRGSGAQTAILHGLEISPPGLPRSRHADPANRVGLRVSLTVKQLDLPGPGVDVLAFNSVSCHYVSLLFAHDSAVPGNGWWSISRAQRITETVCPDACAYQPGQVDYAVLYVVIYLCTSDCPGVGGRLEWEGVFRCRSCDRCEDGNCGGSHCHVRNSWVSVGSCGSRNAYKGARHDRGR